MKISTRFSIVVVSSVLFVSLLSGQTKSTSRISGAINESETVTLSGNVHPVAATATNSDPADEGTPMEHMILYLKGDAGQEAQLEQLIAQQNDPKSPLYHQYLSPAEFGARYGVSSTDIATVKNWLENHGFTIESLPAGSKSIVFSGTAGQVASAFNTEIRRYTVGGAVHYANATDPQIPAVLADTVGGIVKLHNFQHGHSITTPKVISASQLVNPQFTYGSDHYLAPADYGILYDINPLYSAGINGTGQTIAVLARSNIYLSDVQSFRSSFGLKANNPVFVITNSDPGVLEGDSVETTLDTEWSGAVAPNATVKVIISASTNSADGIDLSALYAVNNNVAPIISLSYGSCEAAMGSAELAFYNSLWKQAASQGQTVMVSSGDSGAAGCDYGSTAVSGPGVNGLCSSPYSTCVGGTEFVEGSNPGQYWLPGNNTVQGSAISYIPETVWNESGNVSGGSGLWAGGGGVSITYPKPSWQTGPGVPADGKRDVPDVSLTAAGHDGYLIWLYGGLNSVGGTSAAAPSFAGMMALVNQKTNSKQGVIMSTLYPLAARQATGGPAIFHDITTGNNSVPGQTGYSATTGFDRATGLGSVDANLLVNNWSTSSTSASLSLTASSSSVTLAPGKATQVTVTSSAVAVNAAVALSVTGAPTGLTAAFSPASIASPGSGASTLTLTASSTVTPGTYPLTIKAAGGTQTATLNISVVIAAPTFSLATSASSLNAAAGASAQLSLEETPQNGFSSTVTLSATGLPSGITAAFSPSTLTGTTAGSSTVTFAVAKTVTAGSYPFKISATGGGVTQTASVTVVVTVPASCTLASNPSSVTVLPGQSGAAQVTCGSVQGTFGSSLSLSVTGLPTGVTAKASSSTFAAGSSTTLTISAASNVVPGNHSISVTAAGGSFSQTISVPLVIPAPTFVLAASATSVTATIGKTAQVSVSETPQSGFTSAVTLSVTGLPTGVTAAFSPSTVGGTTAGTSTLTFTVASSAKALTSPLTISATGGGVTKTVSLSLVVTAPVAPTFTLTSSATGVSVKAGATGQVSLVTQHVGTFNSAIALSVTGLPTGVTASFSSASISAPGDGTAVITFNASSAAKAGTYTPVVTATGGGVTHTLSLSLTIAAGPSFTLSLSTSSLPIQQGSSGVLVTSTGNYSGGFNGQLSMTFAGVPNGVTYAVTGANAANNMVNISVTFSVSKTTPVGTYAVTVNDAGTGVSQSATFNIVVSAATSAIQK